MNPFADLRELTLLSPAPVKIYPRSAKSLQEGFVCMADFGEFDALLYLGSGCPFHAAEAVTLSNGQVLSRCDLTEENARILRQLFPFTAPRPVLGEERTFGTGDRLGIATVGHIHAMEKFDVFPVLAQQSMRELRLMGNTYRNIIDRATFQVFRENYQKGFGADGDHLKTAEEVRLALESGCTMITLDCSEHIRSPRLQEEMPLDPDLERLYLGKEFLVEGHTIRFDRAALLEAQWVYSSAIAFARTIYLTCMADSAADLEISIDETDTPTSPAQHFFVACELKRAGVCFRTVAPRFCGEFQKGIDYIGDLATFDEEFRVHAAIARHFGYKLSIHSGSDKFAVYPAIGAGTQGRWHVKTSGTSWLEAVRLVAMKDPALFRELYDYAQTQFQSARAYYHVSTELEQVPRIHDLSDDRLPELLEDDHARQLMHIVYGKIFNEQLGDGTYRFRNRLNRLLQTCHEDYSALLENHIGRHLGLLFK